MTQNEHDIERAARAIAAARGIDPDKPLAYSPEKPAWEYFTEDASAAIRAIAPPTET